MPGEISSREEPAQESAEEKNQRMARGEISETEIAEYLTHPDDVLFEHKIVSEKRGKVSELDIKVRALTKQFAAATLENLRESWDPETFESFELTVKKYFEQKESGKPGLLNVEYYIATDQQDNPIAMTGLYTTDIQGGSGFATRTQLDPERHNLNMGLGWYSVSKTAQGTGLGTYFLNWSENLARTRGAKHLEIETDDSEGTERAVKMYKKSGYKEGFPIESFYGPGRNLNMYYLDAENFENGTNAEIVEISQENKAEILEMAQEIYPPDRFEEFRACLDLFLAQDKERDAVFVGRSVVVNGANGKPESFAIYTDGIYDNSTLVFWTGSEKGNASAKSKLLGQLCSAAKNQEKNIVMVCSEGEDSELSDFGFLESKHGVPKVFGKRDPTKFLLLTKELK